eukprot:TRINITY_DN13274_c0_g1_i1.p1 TRINITY_DN13274_c0_g1~~TRINITY_DN13274_c0_g1_i1.p1  ORF type:complete len:339 (-),score=56.82 TRINITY_DN13274_c0_g1_i1:179-1195(-)
MVKWAPLFLPLERRIQTFAVFSFLSVIVICLITLFLLLFFWRTFWPIILMYMIYFLYDKNTPFDGGRSSFYVRWTRALTKPWFERYAAFFPVKLVIDPDVPRDTFSSKKRFLFSVHPHGWIGCGIWASWLTEGCGIAQKLPIDFRTVTLKTNFYVPFWRDFILGHGLVDCSVQSIENIFRKGIAVVVVPGGARESLYARPSEEVTLVLEGRRGFVKMAITNGAELVPVFSFGEESLYDQVENSPGTKIRRLQDWLLKFTGIAFPLIKGRGMLNYSFGLLPHRRNIHVVIGNPISVPFDSNPSRELVENVHEQYKEALRGLFEKHKARYGYGQKRLVFV